MGILSRIWPELERHWQLTEDVLKPGQAKETKNNEITQDQGPKLKTLTDTKTKLMEPKNQNQIPWLRPRLRPWPWLQPRTTCQKWCLSEWKYTLTCPRIVSELHMLVLDGDRGKVPLTLGRLGAVHDDGVLDRSRLELERHWQLTEDALKPGQAKDKKKNAITQDQRPKLKTLTETKTKMREAKNQNTATTTQT